MSVELASAYVSLVPSFKGGTSAIEKELNVDAAATAAGKSAGQNLSKSIISGATAAAVGVAIGSFLKGAFSEASEAQKVGAQTAAVLKSTGEAANVSADEIGDLANALSKKAGIDDEVIQSGENMLLTFKNVRNEAGKGNDIFNQTTAAALDMAAGMAAASGGTVDLKSASIQLGKALNDPVKGITALTRVGVTFTEAQKEKIKSLVEEGKTLEAQKIILREVNSEFAGSAAANATDADKAKVAIGNFKEAVGTLLLPVLNTGAQALTALAEGFSSLPQPLQSVATFGVLAAGGLTVVAKAVEAVKGTSATLSTVKDGIAKFVGSRAGEGAGLGAIVPAAAAWAGAAFLIGGTAVGLSRTISGEAYKVDLSMQKFAQSTTANLAKALKAMNAIDPQAVRQAFDKLLASDPSQAQRFIDALDQAGIKTGAYKDKLDKVTTAEAQGKDATDRHAKSVADAGGAYQGTTTKIDEQIKKLDERTQTMDAANNAGLRVQTAALNLNDALTAQYDAFILSVQAGGQSATANEDLARQTIATKQAILEDAQAVREQVAAHYGGVAGSIAYKQELERLAGTMAPDSPLRQYIEGLINDANTFAGDHHATLTADASQAIAEINALAAAWEKATPAAIGLAALGGGEFISPDVGRNIDLGFLTDPSNPVVRDFLASLGRRAEGGPVGPGSFVVGEKAPEILTLGAGQSGFVTPMAPAPASSGGAYAGATINYNGPLDDPATRARAIFRDLDNVRVLARL